MAPVNLGQALASVPMTPAQQRLTARNAKVALALSVAPTALVGKKRAPPPARTAALTTPGLSALLRTPPAEPPVAASGVAPSASTFSPGAIGRSVALAMAPLLAEQASAKKLKLLAAPGDLSAPRWTGELEVASQSDKFTLFEAARVRYVATCDLTGHVPSGASGF